MKLDLKSWLLITAAVIIIALLLYIKGCGGSVIVSNDKVDSLAWINKLGDSVKSIIGTKEALASENVALKDSIARIYGYNKDRVDFLIATNLSLQKQLEDQDPAIIVDNGHDSIVYLTTNVLTKKTIDSIKRSVTLSHVFKDKFDTVGVSLGLRNKLNLKIYTGLTAVSGWVKQNGWFKPDLYRIDLSFTNPDVKINGTRSFVAPPTKQKRWGIGPYVGWGYSSGSTIRGQLQAGLSVNYSFIRF